MPGIWQHGEQAVGNTVCSGTSGRSRDLTNENRENPVLNTLPFSRSRQCPVLGEEVHKGGITLTDNFVSVSPSAPEMFCSW